jgi:hypothetical protein
METKQTAVQWLEEKINSESIIPFTRDRFKWLAQAKQMEEIQVKLAYDTGIKHQLDRYASTSSEKYYRETYGKEPKEVWIAISRCPQNGTLKTSVYECGDAYMDSTIEDIIKTGVGELMGLPIIKITKVEI